MKVVDHIMKRSGSGNWNSLDLMKFIAAILVVSIHTTPLLALNETLSLAFENTIARIAVPFFFAASGYLFYAKISSKAARPVELAGSYWYKYTKRIAVIYLVWSLVYGGYDIYRSYEKHDHDMLSAVLYYLRDFVFVGGHFHLWYFPALLFAITGLYFGSRAMSLRKLLAVSIVLYALGLFGDAYFGLLGEGTVLYRLASQYFELFVTTRNGLFFGMVYVVLGAYMYERRLAVRYSRPGVLLTLSIVGLIIEVVALNQFSVLKDCNMLIMLLPATYFLFQLLLNKPASTWQFDNKLLRDSSVLIYCSHGIFVSFYYGLLGPQNARGPYSLLWFALVFLTSLAMTIILIKLRRGEKTSRYVSAFY